LDAITVFAETPNVAAPNMVLGGGGLKQVKMKPVSAEFKQQLKNCLENEQAINFQALFGNRDTDDNSMVINSTVLNLGIAGILEGFGLLDYQTDNLLLAGDDVLPALPKAAREQTDAADMAGLLTEWMRVDKEPKEGELSEQFARMLSNKQLNTSDLQRVLSEVKEYLGSLESTNKEKASNTAAESVTVLPDTDGAADFLKLLLQAKMQKPSFKAQMPLPAENADRKVFSVKHAVFENSQAAEETAVHRDCPAEAQEAEIKAALPKMDGGISGAARQSGDGESKETTPDAVDARDITEGTAAAAGGVQRAKAPETVAETTAEPRVISEQPDFVRDNVVRIVDSIKTQFDGGRHEFDIELKPEFLGKLNIKLTMENGNIRLTVKAGDLSVKGMICEHAPALQDMLKDKGITLTSVDISYQSETPADGGYEAYRQNGRQSQADKGGGRHTPEWLTGTSLYDSAAAADYYIHSGSSVEYLA